jgi:Helicase conserved C-terminal domain
LYNSLSFATYNLSTRLLFINDPDIQIIIATDSLVVGMDFPNVEDVIDLDCHHPNHGKQRKGRAGRPGGNVKSPRGITYVTKATMDKAHRMVKKHPSYDGGKWVEQGLHIGQARLLVAPCYPACENILYDNPAVDPPCHCETCEVEAQSMPPSDSNSCNCSGCKPEVPLPPLPRALATTTSPAIPVEFRLTDKMVRRGTLELQMFRQQLWNEKSDEIGHLPPLTFLPDNHIKNILDNFARIQSLEDLAPYISDLHLLSGLHSRLLAVITELHLIFSSLPRPERKKVVRKPAAMLSLQTVEEK